MFLLGALLFSHFVQTTEFSPRSACFVISALGEPFVSQSERVCAIQRFVPETFYFTHWAHPFLAVFRKVNGFVENSSFSPDKHVLLYLHWAQQVLAFSAKCTSL